MDAERQDVRAANTRNTSGANQPNDGEPSSTTSSRDASRKGTGNDRVSHNHAHHKQPKERIAPEDRPFIRAENEDDDGYDPYSDRQPHAEPLFERDPWD